MVLRSEGSGLLVRLDARYGVVYEIEGPIKTPNGRSVHFWSGSGRWSPQKIQKDEKAGPTTRKNQKTAGKERFTSKLFEKR